MKASCRSLYREGYVSAETDGNDGQRYSYSGPGRVQVELLEWRRTGQSAPEGVFLTLAALAVSDKKSSRYGLGLAVDSLEIIRITDMDQIGAEIRKAIALYDRLYAEYASLRAQDAAAQAAVPF